MKSKELLREIQFVVNLSPRKLAKIFKIEQPSFYRYINGISELNFDKASQILDKCKIYLSNDELIPGNKYCLKLIHQINSKNDGNRFGRVSISMRNLLEFGSNNMNIPSAELIPNKQWRLFYKVLINYIMGEPISKENVIVKEWSPLDVIYECQKDKMDPYFKAHNILLPIGELQWV